MPRARIRCKAPDKSKLSDGELMARYQQDHDLAALEELFVRHRGALLRYVLRLVGDFATAEDAVQWAWLKVIEVARKGDYAVERGAAFRTWLFTLARNHVIDEQRRRLVSIRLASRAEAVDGETLENSETIDNGSVDPVEQVVACDLADWIDSALRLLPFAQREVITLWAAGFESREISAMTRAPHETVLSRKKYAIAKLRSSAPVDIC